MMLIFCLSERGILFLAAEKKIPYSGVDAAYEYKAEARAPSSNSGQRYLLVKHRPMPQRHARLDLGGQAVVRGSGF